MGERSCSVPECSERPRSRGYCNRHYCQWREHGDPTKYILLPRSASRGDRFWVKVDADGDCWVWTARRDGSGYGMFWDGGRLVGAHRWAYESLVGPIPEGLHIDHLCRNRPCVNPDHMEPVTNRENSRRGVAGHLNVAKTECPKGHPYDEINTRVSRGKRHCRECGRQANRDYYRSHREASMQAIAL